ncbi:MAG: hypothetical protein P4M09_18075 [Devosia sp.]|nr:hypothetical protein [Devosia sp.]
MAKSTPVDLRDAIKSIIRNGRGIGTDDVIRELRSKHKANLADNAKYLEHVALVRVINEAWTSRKAGHVEGQEWTCPALVETLVQFAARFSN